jgi:predicted RecB family nuclease
MDAPLIKPSDAKSWSLCARRVWLDNKGNFETEAPEDEFEQLIIELGLEHERAVLEKLAAIFEVKTATSIEDTNRLMAEGVEVIYQAQLLDENEQFSGYPDFLEYRATDAT